MQKRVTDEQIQRARERLDDAILFVQKVEQATIRPGMWKGNGCFCPMGALLHLHQTRTGEALRKVDGATQVLNMPQSWVEGFILGFDGRSKYEATVADRVMCPADWMPNLESGFCVGEEYRKLHLA